MKSEFGVILRPVISEKADFQRDAENVYTFEVHAGANKFEVAAAVERIYGVKVKDVRTVVSRGKMKRVGRTFGKKRNWKKAFVTLHEGQQIALYESV